MTGGRASHTKWLAAAVVALVVLVTVVIVIVVRNQRVNPSPDPNATVATEDFKVNGEPAKSGQVLGEKGAGVKAGPEAPSNVYGWNWDHPVTVWDGTGDPEWRVADAAALWSKNGPQLTMVATEAEADIVVVQGDANAFCGMDPSVNMIGCGGADVVNGEPVHAKIVMNAYWAGWDYKDTLFGGTIHEFGHTLGYGHPPNLTNAESVMGVPIPVACGGGCARTKLSQFDNAGLRYLY